MISVRDPAGLHERLRPVWQRFMRRCREAGLNPVLTFAFREHLQQDRLYQIGRRGIPGERTVTNARGGQSWHNVERDGAPASLAFDYALLDKKGKALLPDGDPAWIVAGEIGEALGLTWLGRDRARDLGHLQLDDRGELTLEEAMAGTDPTAPAGAAA